MFVAVDISRKLSRRLAQVYLQLASGSGIGCPFWQRLESVLRAQTEKAPDCSLKCERMQGRQIDMHEVSGSRRGISQVNICQHQATLHAELEVPLMHAFCRGQLQIALLAGLS